MRVHLLLVANDQRVFSADILFLAFHRSFECGGIFLFKYCIIMCMEPDKQSDTARVVAPTLPKASFFKPIALKLFTANIILFSVSSAGAWFHVGQLTMLWPVAVASSLSSAAYALGKGINDPSRRPWWNFILTALLLFGVCLLVGFGTCMLNTSSAGGI